MSTPRQPDRREVPIGRRVAQLRVRRGMTQQVFADRIGKSKSWVDKVERGVRTLDRLPMIETVAAALGVTPGVLVGRQRQRTPTTDATTAVEHVRRALATYHSAYRDPTPSMIDLDHQIRYAHTAYQHAHHLQVLKMLPDLLTSTRQANHPTGGPSTAGLLIRVYRLTAHVLVKLGEPHLAWLAADRAMTTAEGDPHRTALAAVPLAQALRALQRGRLAMTAATTAAQPLDLAPHRALSPDDLALVGTLLTEAALAAATCGDATAADGLLDRAAHLATTHAERQNHDHSFGPATVDLARALAAAHLGDNHLAIAIHLRVTGGDAWHRLPAEHRAAHLLDAARSYLDIGDPHNAARALVTADHLAPTEVRLRPVTRTTVTAILRTGTTPADLTTLATALGLTHR
ncbi:helix-turn-helix domain-containing protein [Micromonospora sagamiensis]|uniref:Transcriptional regulator with XRE-family HTH domain n=1 Tax=Micromonospora sagamiensis TaxID=47875 RepID=A0A562WL32_9ACTN|nr:helix-turn-helix domain-containing protein [Micromonospora sagamiensis]TWJ30906.1 transcriptional regulator with XRE-family HTH domain [Micromonospora sagamiensis]BCL16055.1 transcriptional regulator [Micromonospora sagamiensis]